MLRTTMGAVVLNFLLFVQTPVYAEGRICLKGTETLPASGEQWVARFSTTRQENDYFLLHGGASRLDGMALATEVGLSGEARIQGDVVVMTFMEIGGDEESAWRITYHAVLDVATSSGNYRALDTWRGSTDPVLESEYREGTLTKIICPD